jgi:hypothetical protein
VKALPESAFNIKQLFCVVKPPNQVNFREIVRTFPGKGVAWHAWPKI